MITDRYHILRAAVPERWVMAGIDASILALRACCGQGFAHCLGCRWSVPWICHTRLALRQTPATRLWPRSLACSPWLREYRAIVVGCGADGLGDDRLDDVVGRVGLALVAPGDPGAGKNGARNRLWPSSLLNTCKGVIVTITDRMAA